MATMTTLVQRCLRCDWRSSSYTGPTIPDYVQVQVAHHFEHAHPGGEIQGEAEERKGPIGPGS